MAIPNLLADLYLKGSIVTVDAIECQTGSTAHAYAQMLNKGRRIENPAVRGVERLSQV